MTGSGWASGPTHSVVVLYDEALMSTGRTATP